MLGGRFFSIIRRAGALPRQARSYSKIPNGGKFPHPCMDSAGSSSASKSPLARFGSLCGFRSLSKVKKTAENVDVAASQLPNGNLKPEDLWAIHSKIVLPKPHGRDTSAWKAIQKVVEKGEPISLKHFQPVKPLGSGDTGMYTLFCISRC